MTKTDRAKALKAGKRILRAQISKDGKWIIHQYSENGGWKKFHIDYPYSIREECEEFIDLLVRTTDNTIKDE